MLLGCRSGSLKQYRYPLKGGPVLLSISQAEPGRNFSQPRARLLVDPCSLLTTLTSKGASGAAMPAMAGGTDRIRVRNN